ncbi:TIGR03757 family integrating conjugative element protein [Aromatoleum anaerobium]|uniref:TIGR03757 family integrating conjugative element protein n=1 Tax=Aromatoleum anaerobium TaxID=182180 RepID=A0ABX1PSU6_9RHOO|nr:TIGR03757 family integrating conjugative element protein [Aromatoleum anaerobium]MCK0508640.1 TIGR03757 family integrating conjugative element protein [Aromatoleum anaerobium]
MSSLHTRLVTALVASIWAVPLVGAQEQVEIFLLATHEVRGAQGAKVFHVDAVEHLAASLSAGLPADPTQAAALARRRFDALSQAERQGASAGAQALALAAQYGLTKVPAIVFDRRAVVYGVLDVEEARALYHAWRARGG